MPDKLSTTNERDENVDDQHEQSGHEQAEQEQADCVPTEIGGRKGLEPTRYGDWEKNGRCIDF